MVQTWKLRQKEDRNPQVITMKRTEWWHGVGIKNLDLSVLCDRVVAVGSVDNFAEC